MMRRLTAVTILLGLMTAACGSSFDADLMVAIESRWMCDVQRSVYAELTDVDAELEQRLAGNGVTMETYADFKDALADDIDLRTQVLEAYESYCAG